MEKNLKRMYWECLSCKLSDDDDKKAYCAKKLTEFGVYCVADFKNKILKRGAFARCNACSIEIRPDQCRRMGGDENNLPKEERRAYGHLGKASGNLGKDSGNLGKDSGNLGGNTNNEVNEQRKSEAAAKPITCQVCERSLPRTQFRATGSRGRFDLRKPMTCEECREAGELPTKGWKKRRFE